MRQFSKLKDSGLILPTPAKGKVRKATIEFASLFALKVADDYIKCEDNNTIEGYVKFLDELCWEKHDEIKNKAKDGKWEVEFGKEDKYTLVGKKAKIAEDEAIEKLIATNRFIKSLIRLFWDDYNDETQSLKEFVNWLPRYIAKL